MTKNYIIERAWSEWQHMCIKFALKSVVQKRTDGYVIESRLVLKNTCFLLNQMCL